MEYARDIILGIKYQKDLQISKIKNWTSSIKTTLKNHKLITFVLLLLTILIITDMVLVNAFLELFIKIY